jgi:2TM domain
MTQQRAVQRRSEREEAMVDQDQQRYERARARVQSLKDFYTHATVYVLVNIGLFVINLLTGGGWWFFFPLIGWGIGLGIHAFSVFGSGIGPWGQEWEERKTRELMDRDRVR